MVSRGYQGQINTFRLGVGESTDRPVGVNRGKGRMPAPAAQPMRLSEAHAYPLDVRSGSKGNLGERYGAKRGSSAQLALHGAVAQLPRKALAVSDA